MNPRDRRIVDYWVDQKLHGTETFRATVDSVRGTVATIRTGGGFVPALTAGHTVVAGDVVECYRPRGVGGQIHIRAVLR